MAVLHLLLEWAKLKDKVLAKLGYVAKYSTETLQCFMDAASAPDFIEAVSQCQYAMHGVEISGGASAQDL